MRNRDFRSQASLISSEVKYSLNPERDEFTQDQTEEQPMVDGLSAKNHFIQMVGAVGET